MSFISLLANVASIVLALIRGQHDKAQQMIGAMKQREADQKETIDDQRDQLQKAANRKPGDSRKRMRDGTF